MNSFILLLSPIENVKVNSEIFGKKIFEMIRELGNEMLKNKSEDDEKNAIKVSSFFNYFFDVDYELEKNKNYKVMIIAKNKEIFSFLAQKLFRKALGKETLIIDKNEFVLKGIIQNDETWTGYYNHNEIMETESKNFSNKLKIKIVTPILKDDKFIFGFSEILSEMIDEFEKCVDEDFSCIREKLLENEEIFEIPNEKYYIKEITLFGENRKSYLGEIDIFIKNDEYKNIIYSLFNFAKFNGIGKFSEYGFGQIIIK